MRNRDILIGSVAAAIAMGITFVARMAFWVTDRDNIFGALLMMILAPLAAFFLQAALSRSREYQADASGAHLLHDGEPLARALEKIEAYAKQVPMDVNPAQATAYIINPFTGRKVQFMNLTSSHPPTADRIARLRSGFPTRIRSPCSISAGSRTSRSLMARTIRSPATPGRPMR